MLADYAYPAQDDEGSQAKCLTYDPFNRNAKFWPSPRLSAPVVVLQIR
ncbi:unannotated protein [freshwater metagenome]|jgi:hypothetical protein|uniref:Unannotated protein n=1 Tax=freshwater metagenome TaxID=449393 RepID=A0A6J6GNN5_9ZZZZ